MSYRKKFSTRLTKRVQRILEESKDTEILKRAQTIYCRAAYGMGTEQIAAITGYSIGTVRNLHSAFLKDGMKLFEISPRGGRNNADMSGAEEAAFVSSFDVEGKAGGILEVSRVHRAHCEKVGRNVAVSTTYDLLHRHGWRKVAPRPRHPKANEAAQAAFKKMA
jgi:transposase